MRVCSKCKLGKPLSEFYPKRRPNPLWNGWNGTCKECGKFAALKWARENKTKHTSSTRNWRLKNKELHAKSVSAWAKKNVSKRNHDSAIRRAKRFNATPSWANEFFISEAYDLARLRTKVMGFKWHVDHIVPLKSKIVCGLHVENNLQVIPAVQNLRKHNRVWPDMP